MDRIKSILITSLSDIEKKYSFSNKPTLTSKILFGIDSTISSNVDLLINNYICIQTNKLILYNTKLKNKQLLYYKNIENVSISMSSRKVYHAFGIIHFTYQVDLDIQTKNENYHFEIYKPTKLVNLIKKLDDYEIKYSDKIGVVDIYNKYPDEYKRNEFLDYNFKNIANKFNLDNPRHK